MTELTSSASQRVKLQPRADLPAVVVKGVSQEFVDRYGNHVRALNEVNLEIPARQFVALVGPSGCGKTTLLNMIGSLLTPTNGTVEVLGEPAGKIDRRVGYMFARDGLLPWRTARGNVILGPQVRGMSRSERHERGNELLATVGLQGFEDAYPSRLSQGMRQRVAIARTLAVRPELILLDEPFAALDAHTRTMVQAEFTRLWEETASTVVMVTHDIQEAVALADRIVVMSGRPGEIIADLAVDFPRPRHTEEIRYTHQFADLSEEIWTLLKQK